MKIESFSLLNKKNDEYTKSFNLNKDINFLYGINGCGKTTYLNLINDILSKQFIFIDKIDFDEIKIDVSIDGRTCCIKVEKKVGLKVFFDTDIVYERNKLKKMVYLKENEVIEYFEEIPIKKDNLDKWEIKEPLFLGLDRIKSNYNSIEVTSSWEKKKKIEALDGINQVDINLKNYIFKIKSDLDIKKNVMLKDILNSAFEIENSGSVEELLSDISDIDIVAEKSKIIGLIKELDLLDNTSSIDKYYKDIEKLLKLFKKSDSKLSIKNITPDTFKLIMNFPQLKKIQQLINRIFQYKEEETESYKMLNTYKNIVNDFFYESNKKIDVIDNKLVILKNEKPFSLNNLSSGEKQILVLISTLIFSEKCLESGILIIDEPEISLHISWQENFVSSIRKLKPNLQVIIATHSPSIVENYLENREYFINLSNRGE